MTYTTRLTGTEEALVLCHDGLLIPGSLDIILLHWQSAISRGSVTLNCSLLVIIVSDCGIRSLLGVPR